MFGFAVEEFIEAEAVCAAFGVVKVIAPQFDGAEEDVNGSFLVAMEGFPGL